MTKRQRFQLPKENKVSAVDPEKVTEYWSRICIVSPGNPHALDHAHIFKACSDNTSERAWMASRFHGPACSLI